MQATFQLGLIMLLTSSLCWTSCTPPVHFHDELADIISQHYTELPSRQDLKPIYLYTDWMQGKDSVSHRAAKNTSWNNPSLPPDDTTLVSNAWLAMMGDSIPDFDTNYMLAYLTQQPAGATLAATAHPSLQLIDTSQLCRTYRRYQDRSIPCQRSYYYFSRPVCNQARNICWFDVDEIKGPASSGWRMIYRKKGDTWVEVYAHMRWIS